MALNSSQKAANRLDQMRNRTAHHLSMNSGEAALAAENRIAGNSCISCSNCRAVKFSLHCSIKNYKPVGQHNTCHLWNTSIIREGRG